jgi:hypothetical protein
MKPVDRLNRALVIENALLALMTDDEAETYECLIDHLGDYISDLTIDHQNTLGSDV